MFSELLSIGQGYGRQYRSTGTVEGVPSTASTSTSFQCANLLQITQPQPQITPTTILVVLHQAPEIPMAVAPRYR